MFAAIHLRNKWILRNVRCHIFVLPISLFLFIIIHVLPRPPRRRRGRFIVPVPTNTPEMALQYTIPHPRTPTKWHCNTSYRVHETPTKWHCDTSYHAPEHPQNGVALVLFGNMIFTYFWVLPTFLYLTNFAFAK